MRWIKVAEKVEKKYGTYVDKNKDERMFICPECDEPILEEDYPCFHEAVCPICGYDYENDKYEEEDEEDDG